ncbi:MAG: glycoside hydrolase family 5 protein, partial [Pannonibacter phragmitetus]
MAGRAAAGPAPARLISSLLATLLWLPAVSAASAQTLTCLRGANVAGAEFGDTVGKLGTTHFYPTQKTLTYLAGKGMNIVRFPFKWERLQPELYGPLDDRELTPLLASVAMARQMGFTVILDPHTNARFAGKQIGSPEVPTAAFVDFWRRMSAFHAGDPQVMFELQNEPDYMDAAFWLPSVNA